MTLIEKGVAPGQVLAVSLRSIYDFSAAFSPANGKCETARTCAVCSCRSSGGSHDAWKVSGARLRLELGFTVPRDGSRDTPCHWNATSMGIAKHCKTVVWYCERCYNVMLAVVMRSCLARNTVLTVTALFCFIPVSPTTDNYADVCVQYEIGRGTTVGSILVLIHPNHHLRPPMGQPQSNSLHSEMLSCPGYHTRLQRHSRVLPCLHVVSKRSAIYWPACLLMSLSAPRCSVLP